MGKLTRPRFLIMYALIPLVFLLASSSGKQFRIGIPVVCLGFLIRIWANGYVGHQKVNVSGQEQRKMGRLITAGPYAYVRHPLYGGTFLIALGIGIIVGQPVLVIVAFIGLALIYQRKMLEEEKTLAEECGEAFIRYHAAVRRWAPRLMRYRDRHGAWSWRGIAASKEWKTVIWVSVFLIALYLRKELWQERAGFTEDNSRRLLVFSLIAIVLAATDGVIELLRIRRHLKRV